MVYFIQILNEAFLSFGLKETICFLIATLVFRDVGTLLYYSIHCGPREWFEIIDLSRFMFKIALFVLGCGCVFISPIWLYPAIEIKIFIIIWCLIWISIGWIKARSMRSIQ